MPIKVAVENRDELRLVVYHYSGHIDQASVIAALTRGLNQLAPNQAYRELLIFDHSTDLSDFDAEALTALHRACEEIQRNLKLGPRTAVAMLDDSADAKMIMPLFNAMSQLSDDADLSFELFTRVEPALERLGVPVAEGLKVASRAT
jgi:hypothetical protein